ncbi:MAG: UvrD-helicase domain-containing protein [Flavobacteriales bacterium]|nr:UvrD-helicase domain-containing protein [Flavobacteriales bacterium]
MSYKTNKNFVVYRSSAGSGKTFTLVKEFIKLLLTAHSADYFRHILAITFTNKASAEMKERILNALREFAAENGQGEKNTHLLKQIEEETGLPEKIIKEKSRTILKAILHQYSDFSISTIDKFTHRVVRAFARDLHLPVNFEVYLDKDDILEQAVDLLIEQIGENEYITQTLTEFAISRMEEEKSWSPRISVLEFVKTILFNENNESKVETLKKADFEKFKMLNEHLKRVTENFEHFISSRAKIALSKIQEKGLNFSCYAGGESKGLPKYFTYIVEGRSENYFPTDTVCTMVSKQILYATKANKEEQEVIKEITPELIRLFNEINGHVTQNYSTYYIANSAQKHLYALSLIGYVEKYINELQSENNLLLLAHFNKLINDVVISEPVPFIYERMGEHYHHIMIDEFQDTSVLQWQNLLPLVENSLAGGYFNMLVGDAKQSIYRWRGGVSEQFTELPQIYPPDSPELILEKEATLQRNYQEKKLSSNYRSCCEIIDFNNQFFSLIAQSSEDIQSLYKEVEQTFNPKNTGGYVQINLFPQKTSLAEEDYFLKLNEILKELLVDGYSYKEIAVITSTNKEGVSVADYLTSIKINVISPDSLLVFSSLAVKWVIATLKLLSTPYDITSRVVFIKSYLDYMNMPEKLTAMALTTKKAKLPIKKFIKEITKDEIEVEEITSLSLPEQCEYIIKHFLKIENHDAYLLCFVDAVNDFSKRSGNDIPAFIDWWNDSAERISVKIPENTNAVTLLTVHKSKGLEFPVVIYFYANKRERRQKEFFWAENVLKNDITFPYLLVKGNKALEDTDLADEYKLEATQSKRDLVNEMYVAFTRPVNRLYILCNRIPESKKSSNTEGGSFSVNKFISNFLLKKELFNNEQNQYTFGKKEKFKQNDKKEKDKNKNEQIIQQELEFVQSANWQQKISISRQAPNEWNVLDYFDARTYGILIHRLLQEADSASSIQKVENAENISPEIFKKIIELALLLWEKSEIEKYLSSGYTARSEAAILSHSRLYIPDKVLQKENIVVLIDFKTGEKQEKHITQVKEYMALYKQMGYSVDKGLLVYKNETIELAS